MKDKNSFDFKDLSPSGYPVCQCFAWARFVRLRAARYGFCYFHPVITLIRFYESEVVRT